jgi:hypothetical protein
MHGQGCGAAARFVGRLEGVDHVDKRGPADDGNAESED